MSFRLTRVAAAVLALFTLPAPAAPGDPAGPEFIVNSSNTGANFVDVALDGDGNFVAVWQGFDGNNSGAFLRRFAADGTALAPQAVAHGTAIAGFQGNPAVARAPGGNFVVVWQGAGGGASSSIFMRLFDAAGVALTAVTRVNPAGTDDHANADVAMAPDGSFVVVWQHSAAASVLLGQRFDAAGAPQGAAVRLDSLTTAGGTPANPAVAIDDDGAFAVVWDAPDGSGAGVWKRNFSEAGVAAGPEARVNDATAGEQHQPAIAMTGDGRSVVTWTHSAASDQGDVRFQRFSAAGTPAGGETVASEPPSAAQFGSNVAMDGGGNFVVTFSSNGLEDAADEFNEGIYGRRFLANGGPSGAQFHVNTSTESNQSNAQVGRNAAGAFVVVWESSHLSFGRHPVGQRFEGSPAPAQVDLSIVINDIVDPVATGSGYSYDVRVTNNDALDTATNVTASVTGAEDLALTAFSSGDWTCSGSGPVDCSLGVPLAPGTMTSFAVGATAPENSGEAVATASVEATEPDSNNANNHDSESTTVVVPDTVPDQFQFTDRTGLATGKPFRSNVITVSGITMPAPISISGPVSARYQIDDEPFTAEPGHVVAGDRVRIELRAATKADSANAATLDIGGVSDRWVIRTGATDTSPDVPAFVDVDAAEADSTVTSNAVVLGGFNAPVTVSLIGGSATGELSLNGGLFSRDTLTANPGDTLRLQVLSARNAGERRLVKVKLGTTTDSWVVRTGP